MTAPTQKQIDFADAIAETLGIDPPFDGSREDYQDFISENLDEFYKERRKQRYEIGKTFTLDHQYSLESFNDGKLNANPKTI